MKEMRVVDIFKKIINITGSEYFWFDEYKDEPTFVGIVYYQIIKDRNEYFNYRVEENDGMIKIENCLNSNVLWRIIIKTTNNNLEIESREILSTEIPYYDYWVINPGEFINSLKNDNNKDITKIKNILFTIQQEAKMNNNNIRTFYGNDEMYVEFGGFRITLSNNDNDIISIKEYCIFMGEFDDKPSMIPVWDFKIDKNGDKKIKNIGGNFAVPPVDFIHKIISCIE